MWGNPPWVQIPPPPRDHRPAPTTALDDAAAMRLALDAAREAGAAGDVPVGAVALHDGRVLAVAGNARERRRDPTAHAELLVLRAAAAALGTLAPRRRDRRRHPGAVPDVRRRTRRRAGRAASSSAPRTRRPARPARSTTCACDPRLNHEVAVTAGVLARRVRRGAAAFFAERRAP